MRNVDDEGVRRGGGKKLRRAQPGIKGKSTNPGSSFSLSSRLRLFRIGDYRCNQVTRSIPLLCDSSDGVEKRTYICRNV